MYKLFDGGGLFLQVNPTGGKYWKMKYRKDDGKEGLLTFGRYPAVTLEQARKKREEAKSQKASGIDPIEAKKQEKAEKRNRARNTFEAVARAWMDIHSTKIGSKGLRSYQSLLEKYAFPLIGSTPVKNLRAPDFLEVFRQIEALGYSSTIKRARSSFSLIMRYAVAAGLADFDPIPALRGSLRTYRKNIMPLRLLPKKLAEFYGQLIHFREHLLSDAPYKYFPMFLYAPVNCGWQNGRILILKKENGVTPQERQKRLI